VAAGNDTYSPEELRRVLGDQPLETGLSWDEVLALGEARRGEPASTFAITALALRLSNHSNGVSPRHGEVARRMWAPVWGPGGNEPVPIGHVTNGVHLPTWTSPPMQALFDRYLPVGWGDTAAEPATWAAVEAIPDEEIWAVRRQLRGELVSYIRERSVQDRLARGRSPAYAEGAAREWDADTLTIGFARRIATYKRLHLLTLYPERAVRLLSTGRGAQLVLAGKAHPDDDDAKRTVAGIFAIDEWPGVGEHVVFLDEYDIPTAQRLVAGCDPGSTSPTARVGRRHEVGPQRRAQLSVLMVGGRKHSLRQRLGHPRGRTSRPPPARRRRCRRAARSARAAGAPALLRS
jgi:starch phosphorylase